MNQELIKKAKGILALGKIEKIDNRFYKVDGETVSVKDGIFSCTCNNCTINVNNQRFCHRKIAVVLFESQDFGLKRLIRETSEHLEECEKVNTTVSHDVIRCLLNDLRSFI